MAGERGNPKSCDDSWIRVETNRDGSVLCCFKPGDVPELWFMCMNRSFGAAVIELVEVVRAQSFFPLPLVVSGSNLTALLQQLFAVLLTWVEPIPPPRAVSDDLKLAPLLQMEVNDHVIEVR